MNAAGIPSILDVLVEHNAVNGTLHAALVEREEAMADAMRMAAVQFNLYPQIVSEVLASLEFGRILSEEERTYIHREFHLLMEELSRQQGQ